MSGQGNGDSSSDDLMLIVFIAVCSVCSLRVMWAFLKAWRWPPAVPMPAAPRTIAGLFDQTMPAVFDPAGSLLQHYWEELKAWHCYSHSLRSAWDLFFHAVPVLGLTVLITQHAPWDGLSASEEVLFTACACNLLAVPFAGLGDLLTDFMEDTAAAAAMHSLHPSEEEETKDKDMEYGNEADLLQSRRGTLLRAARLLQLTRSDYSTVSSELALLVPAHWAQRPEAFVPDVFAANCRNALRFAAHSLQHTVYNPSDPAQIAILFRHARLLQPTLLQKRLQFAREQAAHLRGKLEGLTPSSTSSGAAAVLDELLLRYFLVYWFSGLEHRLAQIVLIEQAPAPLRRCMDAPRRRCMHVPRRLLLLLCVGLLLFTAQAGLGFWISGLRTSSAVQRRLVVKCLLAHLLRILIIAPLAVLLQALYAPRYLRSAFGKLHRTCRSRFRYILGREASGTGAGAGAGGRLLAHLHPVLRVARCFPAQALTRIFLSLRDDDLLAASYARPVPAALLPQWQGSPLLGDCLQYACAHSMDTARRWALRAQHTAAQGNRLLLHVCLLGPKALRAVLWQGAAASAVAAVSVLGALASASARTPAAVALLAVACGLCLWSLLGHCFLFRGPLRMAADALAGMARAISNYLVREKQQLSLAKSKRRSKLMLVKVQGQEQEMV